MAGMWLKGARVYSGSRFPVVLVHHGGEDKAARVGPPAAAGTGSCNSTCLGGLGNGELVQRWWGQARTLKAQPRWPGSPS